MRDRCSTALTSKNLRQLIPGLLRQIGRRHQERPDFILLAWPSLIGERLAPMTRAESFVEGILTVRVRNSSLLSVLTQHERPKLLKQLRQKFPSAKIRNIRFLIG